MRPGGFLITATRLTGLFLVALLIGGASLASDIRIGHEHADPRPFELVTKIINQSIATFGSEHTLHWVNVTTMNQARALKILEECNAPFDIFFTGYDSSREQKLLQVDVPLTLGLLGVRGFVSRSDRQQQLEAAVADIRNWQIGSGDGWPDTRIMHANRFRVETSGYNSLWKMLERNRFDAFQRGIQEAQIEIEDRTRAGFATSLLNNVLMIYPLDFFLYVSPCKPELQQTLEQILLHAFQAGLIHQLIADDQNAALALSMLNDPDVTKIALKNDQTSANFKKLVGQFWLPEIASALAD